MPKRLSLVVGCALLTLALSASALLAEERARGPVDGANPPPTAHPSVMTEATRTTLQMALAVYGGYRGPLDGVLGPKVEAAIRRFQSLQGMPVTGVLTPAQRSHLDDRLRDFIQMVEFRLVEEQEGGALFPVPLTLSRSSRMVDGGRLYGSETNTLNVFAASMRGDAKGFRRLFEDATASTPESRVEKSYFGGDWFFAQGSQVTMDGVLGVWAYYTLRDGVVRGLSYSYDSGEGFDPLMRLLTYFAGQLYVPFPAEEPARAALVRALLPMGGGH